MNKILEKQKELEEKAKAEEVDIEIEIEIPEVKVPQLNKMKSMFEAAHKPDSIYDYIQGTDRNNFREN